MEEEKKRSSGRLGAAVQRAMAMRERQTKTNVEGIGEMRRKVIEGGITQYLDDEDDYYSASAPLPQCSHHNKSGTIKGIFRQLFKLHRRSPAS